MNNKEIIHKVFKNTDNYYLLRSDIISQIIECMELVKKSEPDTTLESGLRSLSFDDYLLMSYDKKGSDYFSKGTCLVRGIDEIKKRYISFLKRNL